MKKCTLVCILCVVLICSVVCASSCTFHKHNLQEHAAVEATCKQEGSIAYWYCSVCKKYFADSAATTEIDQSTIRLEKISHTPVEIPGKESTCLENGLTAGTKCSVCGEVIEPQQSTPKGNHVFVDGICSVCGATPVQYTVEFNSMGGSPISSSLTDANGLVSKPQNPTKEGYNFLGWYREADCLTMWVFGSDKATENITLYAKYAPKTYTVTFDCVGGILQGEVETVTLTYGEAVGPLPEAKKEGQSFVGWYYKNVLVEEDTVWNTDASNIVFVAKYVEDDGHSILSSNVFSFTDDTTLYTIVRNSTDEFDLRNTFEVSAKANWRAFSSADCSQPTEITTRKISLQAGDNDVYVMVENTETYEQSVYHLVIHRNEIFALNLYYNDSVLFKTYNVEENISIAENIQTYGVWFEKENYTWDEQFYVSTSYTQTVNLNSKVQGDTNLYALTYYHSNRANGQTGTLRVIVPQTETQIPNSAFANCNGLVSIEMGVNIVSIGSNAFNGCGSLTSISIPKSVTNIGESAFYNCFLLETVIFVDNSQCTSIGSKAFYNCISLVSIIIPESVTSIGDSIFYNCSKLTSITIPESVTSIGSKAFYDCSSLTIYCEAASKPSGWDSSWNGSNRPVVWYLRNTVLIDGIRYALKDGNATVARQMSNISGAVTIPQSVTCNGTTYTVTSIGSSAFSGCSSLTSITIPNSITSINNYAFDNCSSLTIYCEVASKPSGWNSSWNSSRPVVWDCNNSDVADDGNIYVIIDEIRCALKDGNATVARQPSNIRGEVTIPQSVTCNGTTYTVTSIGSEAFSYCSSLTSITIPEGITSIGNYAFCHCSSLTSITIPDSVTSIGYYAISYCSSLTSITIPEGVTRIGFSAFSGCGSLTIYCEAASKPGGWYSDWNIICPVVWDCNNSDVADDGNIYVVIDGIRYALKDGNATVAGQPSNIRGAVTIPQSVTCNGTTYIVTSIVASAFRGCSALTDMTLPFVGSSATATTASSSTLFGYIFGTDSYTGGTSTRQYYGSGNSSTYYIPSTLHKVTITGGNILHSAFYNCSMLTSVVIGEGVTSIGDGAFYNCSSLEEIILPNGRQSIGSDAIYGTAYYNNEDNWENGVLYLDYILVKAKTNLRGDYTIKEGTKIIADRAFASCASLVRITIPEGVTRIGDSAFGGCTSLTSITIPEGVTRIGNSAFGGCTSLTSITIPDSVISIGYSAFIACSSLERITIPASVTSIGFKAFYDCISLRIYCEAASKPSGWDSSWNGSNRPVVWNCNNMS